MEAQHPPPYSVAPETVEAEAVVEYVRGTGPGGQHKNKRETGIRLTHPPSGVVVMATERRSRIQNTSLAFERLLSRLVQLNYVPDPRVPTKVPRGVKRRRVENKRRVSLRKASRRVPKGDE